MGELVCLATHREKKMNEEIEVMRKELKRLMASWTMVGLVFVSPIPPLGFKYTELVPVEIPVQIL